MLQLICTVNTPSQQKLLIAVLFLFTISPTAHFIKCPTEHSIISGTKNKALWVNSEGIDNQIVTSHPPCLNTASKLTTRVCKDGFWHPATPPICQPSPKENTCPDNFQKIEDFCVDVTDPQVWSTNASLSTKTRNGTQSRRFWLPVRRTVKFGDFEYVEIGTDYGSTIPIDVDSKEYYSGDCLLYDTKINKIRVENCTNSHPVVRYFEQNAPLYDCPKGCVATNSDFQCFCRSQQCRSLASVETLNDKELLKSLVGNDTCRISGVEKNSDSFLSESLWQSGNFTTNCSICKVRAFDSDKTKLVLSFEDTKKDLYLLVYSPESLKKHEDELLIFCFTNAGKTKLKKKCNTDLLLQEYRSPKFPESFFVYKVEIEKYMGEYWCEAFSQTHSLLKSEKVIAYERKKGNEYAVRLIVDYVCKLYSCSLEEFFKVLTKNILKRVFEQFSAEIRVMQVFNFDIYKDELDVLVHMSTGKNLDISEEHKLLNSQLKSFNRMKVVYFRSCEFCLPESLRLNETEITWPLTKINNVAVSEEFCFLKEGTPVTRQCHGNFLEGATWSEATGSCIENPTISNVTEKLKKTASLENIFLEDVWNNVRGAKLTLLDIYYLNIILSKIKEADIFALNFVNELIGTEGTVLEESQHRLNLTDNILETLENILTNISRNPESVYFTKENNLIVHVTNPFLNNISGLLLYGPQGSSFSDFSVYNFKRGHSLDNIERHNLELVAYVPEEILQQLQNETNNSVSDIYVITVVFRNDNFFVDENYHSENFVVSVSIPGYGSYLKSPISIIFNSKRHNTSKVCGFWDHGRKMNRKKGEWSVLGGNYAQLNESLHVCSFVHLTHFALLLMSDTKIIIDEDAKLEQNKKDYNLEIITNIGCSFSIFGIAGIFTTAAFYKNWRNKIGTKILLNLSIAILFELICIHLSEFPEFYGSETICKIIGMILHYVVLSKFSWMLIYALLQYYRFVKVIGVIPKNLILKSVIVGWGIPLAFVFLIGLSPTKYYVSSSYELCYPRGLLLYLTVILPICLIMLANTAIFCLVMYNVTYKTNSCGSKKLFRLRLYLALLLFSVLGVPWIFGILAALLQSSLLKEILFYIFCVTATFQGFVLFLFYVVLNTDTREFWKRFLTRKFTNV